MKHHAIPRIVTKLIIPLILLFGLYVQFHGEYSAGGGFQAGVIFAAGFILYAVIFSLELLASIRTFDSIGRVLLFSITP